MVTDALRPFRERIDAASLEERASFARAARNAVAQAILASALAAEPTPATQPPATGPPEHEPPEAEIRALLGADLGGELAALYRGGDDWTSRAIDLLAPLNEVAHAR